MKIEIEKYNPCQEAIEYRMQFETFEAAWEACPRGDWMLWIAKKVDVDIRILTKAKALCAMTVRHLMKDERSLKACEVALKFSEGLATKEDLADAADDAYAAADDDDDDDDDDAYADAAYAAAYAADAAVAAAAAAAADAAAYADSRIKSEQETANICREVLTKSVFEKLNIKVIYSDNI